MFGDKRNRETEEKLAKERELQKVHVKKEDIELIVSIFVLQLRVPGDFSMKLFSDQRIAYKSRSS